MLTKRNACNAIAATAKDAATASVRGENPAMMAANWPATARAGLRLRGLGVDGGHQPVHAARRRHAKGLVERNRLGELFTHQIGMVGESGIVAQRILDALAVAPTQRARGIPRQQGLDLCGFHVSFAYHGQPRSIPAILHNSPSFLRA
jgi:hypothetical protein